MTFNDESTSDWIETRHDRVFYRTREDKWDRGEFEIAEWLATNTPGWIVAIEMGEREESQVKWEFDFQESVLYLSFDNTGIGAYKTKSGNEHKREAADVMTLIITTIYLHPSVQQSV